MIELLEGITYWHWIILALLLLGGEALGAAGFMLGISISALLVAALMAMGVLDSWQGQFLIFALFSIIASIVVWKFFKTQNKTDDASVINDRAAQLIGRKLTLQDDVENGLGRVQIGDTYWKVSANVELAAGTKVEVFATEGMVLQIRPVN